MGRKGRINFPKKHSTSYKNSKSVKFGLLALAVLLIILLLGRVVSLVSSLSQPLNLSLSKDQYSFDGKSSINAIFASFKNPDNPTIFLVNLNPRDKKATVLHISNQIYTNLPRGYGSWKIGSIYQLGQEENPQNGLTLLSLSISKLLGLPVDVVLVDEKLDTQTAVDLIDSWHTNLLVRLSSLTTLKTNLSLLDRVKYLMVLSSVRSDKVTSLDLEKSVITQSQLLPDSSRVLGVDNVKLDTFIRDNMSDTDVTFEGKSIAIFNATNHQGLAQEATRVVTNLGGNVVMTANTDDLQNQSQIILHDSSISAGATFSRLTQYFAPRCLKSKCTGTDPKLASSRAQINIILGEDFFNFWYRR